jgi:hypothetical protein
MDVNCLRVQQPLPPSSKTGGVRWRMGILPTGVLLLAFVAAAFPQLALGLSLGVSSPASGTLVVAAPSKDGLIVAADRRARIGGRDFCDLHHKITELASPDRTVLVVAGATIQIPAPPRDMGDACTYLRQAPRYLDIDALAKKHIEMSGTNSLTAMDELAAACVETIAGFQKSHGDEIRGFWGKRMFTVILATYVPAERTAVIKRFSLMLRPDGEPFISERDTQAVGPTSRNVILAFGESEFLHKEVLNGPGRQFLTGAYREWRTKARIADIDRSVAVNAAVDVIEAAAKTADLLHTDVAIGGPVDAVLLGEAAKPQRVRWQAP